MSSLIVNVCKIDRLSPIEKADKIEVAHIGGWECVVPKGKFQPGDKVVYVPPDVIVPKEWSDRWGVTQYLGSNGRVKSIKLRGQVSMGLVVECDNPKWEVGHDVVDYYGITKYEPPPIGESRPTGKMSRGIQRDSRFHNFSDPENLRHDPDVFTSDDEVVVTEKIHGCLVGFGMINGKFVARSKGLQREKPSILYRNTDISLWEKAKLFFKGDWNHTIDDIEKIKNCFWWSPYLNENIRKYLEWQYSISEPESIFIWGETYGSRVQNLHYGLKDTIGFAAFDISINGRYVSYDRFVDITTLFQIATVPTLYVGKYDKDIIKKLSRGKSLLYSEHIREGCVVRGVDNKVDQRGNRIIRKYINDDYLLGKETGQYTDSTDI